MNLETYQASLSELSFGKRLPTAIYIHALGEEHVTPELGEVIGKMRAELQLGDDFNVLKFHTKALKISFLSYPAFFKAPHPVLEASVTVDLALGRTRRADYSKRANRPILHRKEAFLPPGHRNISTYRALTEQEEIHGLFEDTATIGFEENWGLLLAEKNLAYEGHRLISLIEEERASPQKPQKRQIDRAKTAIVRHELSKPIKSLLQNGLLRRADTLFDYGCGLGTDVAGLQELGYDAAGWDPAYAPNNERKKADIVNLGFVLNVIEDPAERIEALTGAWNLTGRLLIVTTLVEGNESYAYAEPYRDGIVTQRNTFQKYFNQSELQHLIEIALDGEVTPAGLGVFYVFCEFSDLQDYLSSRTKRVIDWESINRTLRFLRPPRPSSVSLYQRHQELLDHFWSRVLELGRLPAKEDYDYYDDVRETCQSIPRAAHIFLEEEGGEAALEEARRRRKEDLLVYLAGGEFQKRRTPFTRVSPAIRRDVKAFFGTYPGACDEARDTLFAAGDSDELELAIEELEFGWIDSSERHLTIHRDFLDFLPPILRIFVECGSRLYGDPREADLIKIHFGSKKLTLLHYLDFGDEPFPELRTRIKIDLRRLFVSVFDHGVGPDHQILFFKERFLPLTAPGRKQMEATSKRLRRLGISEGDLGTNDTAAPSKEAFEAARRRLCLTRILTKKGT